MNTKSSLRAQHLYRSKVSERFQQMARKKKKPSMGHADVPTCFSLKCPGCIWTTVEQTKRNVGSEDYKQNNKQRKPDKAIASPTESHFLSATEREENRRVISSDSPRSVDTAGAKRLSPSQTKSSSHGQRRPCSERTREGLEREARQGLLKSSQPTGFKQDLH